MSIQEWKSQGKYFSNKRYVIFYSERGEGEPLLLLHGYPTSSWDFVKIRPPLEQSFRVVTLDFIGFGFSDKPKNYVYSIPDQADWVEKLMIHLQIDSVNIVAHDYAVSVAQELLARQAELKERPVKIKSIVFLNGGLFAETHKPRIIQKLLHSRFGFLISKFSNYRLFKKSFIEVFGPSTQPAEEELREFWLLITWNEGQLISHKLINYISDRRIHRDRWVSAMQSTTVPMRLINGNMDPVSGIHLAKRYAQLIPDADIIHLPAIGHYPQTEAPDEVVKFILDFISLHKGGV